jgi:NADPH:quinone reductase-like Zn-dependent oxidoreductase
VASEYNVCRIPDITSGQALAGLGVAFVAAVLALGVCLGSDFSSIEGTQKGPNLRKILRSLDRESVPQDVRKECFEGIPESEIPQAGDWIVIWGGSSTSARILAQLAKLVGLRVIKVVDVGKHGEALSQEHADLLVDNVDPERAVEIIKRVTRNNLRFGVDTIGKNTAELLQKALRTADSGQHSHLVGLTGLPKETLPGIEHHVVPIKIHHEVQPVGESLMAWLENLLLSKGIRPPEVEVAPGGLEGVNDALDRLRRGEVSGKRLLVKLE